MMSSRNLRIKKYDYLPGVGNLYLVADFKKIFDAPHLIIHKIVINTHNLEEHTFSHQTYKYNLKQHLSQEIPLDVIVESLMERHLNVFWTEGISGKSSGIQSGPIREAGCGERVLNELQFTSIFKELKVSILKESRSDAFSKILTGMNHLPLYVSPDTSSLKQRGLTGTSSF